MKICACCGWFPVWTLLIFLQPCSCIHTHTHPCIYTCIRCIAASVMWTHSPVSFLLSLDGATIIQATVHKCPFFLSLYVSLLLYTFLHILLSFSTNIPILTFSPPLNALLPGCKPGVSLLYRCMLL